MTFNPLDMHNLADSIVRRMEETPPTPLGKIKKFEGAGIYAIYYFGNHPAYAQLAIKNHEICREPIYVGKAVPAGGRRGFESAKVTTALWKRLSDHAKSVRAAEDLDINDFSARWLVVTDIWIPLGESAMIRRYRPVWNAVLDGFGNHNPGSGRIAGVKSRWDTFHPGRKWAEKFPARPETGPQIAQDVTEYLRSRT